MSNSHIHPKTIEMISAADPSVRPFMRQFPPGCIVQAREGVELRCPAPGQIGRVVHWRGSLGQVGVSDSIDQRRRHRVHVRAQRHRGGGLPRHHPRADDRDMGHLEHPVSEVTPDQYAYMLELTGMPEREVARVPTCT